MDSKLTLKLDQATIEKAKGYARNRKTSLSKLVENYLHKVTSEKKNEGKITPLVKSLSGILELPKNYNHKKEYAGYLTDKYK